VHHGKTVKIIKIGLMEMFNKEFWSYSIERGIKTIAQAAVAYLGSGSLGLFSIDWASLMSVSLGAGLLSILTSIATLTKKSNS